MWIISSARVGTGPFELSDKMETRKVPGCLERVFPQGWVNAKKLNRVPILKVGEYCNCERILEEGVCLQTELFTGLDVHCLFNR